MPKRVILLHNPGAGLEEYSKEELIGALQKKDFLITYVDVKSENYEEKLKESADLLVVAGGDGTVKKIAKHIIGKEIPIGLLPLGTANNIANSLKLSGKPAEIINLWDLDRRKPFDVGVVNGPAGENLFLESCGFGLLPRLIRQHSRDNSESTNREKEMEKALRHQRRIVGEYMAHLCSIQIDGQDLSGKYLLVEIMNIQQAGPNLELASRADPGDGLLDVVLVKEEDREKFSDFVSSRIQGKESASPLKVQRVKNLKVVWEGNHYHLDDEAHEEEAPVQLEIRILPKKLEFLVI